MSLKANAAVKLAALFLALTAVLLCWWGAPLLWDGSYQLCLTLIEQKPFFYHTRFFSYPLWLPVLWLSKITSNPQALVFAFGLPVCLAPAISLLLCWWLVRRSAPWLIVWAALGICAISLPGQAFLINDSIFQGHLFWPLYLGLLMPVARVQKIVLTVLAIFQLSHPLGAPLLLGAAVATGYLGWRDTTNRRQWLLRTGLLLALALAACAKILLWPDPYAREEASLEMVRSRFSNGVLGWPAMAVFCLWVCATLVWRSGRGSEHTARWHKWMAFSAMICYGLGAGALVIWAANPQQWASAINYRRWAAPFTLPVLVFALLETTTPPSSSGSLALSLRSALVLGCGALFAIVLSLQGEAWSVMSHRLVAEIERRPGPIVPLETLGWLRGTPLDHWSIVSCALLVQGRQPLKLVLSPEGVAAVKESPPRIALAPWDIRPIRPGVIDWFNYASVMRELEDERLRTK